MFRLGDFYELFYDDAVTAARELEITLTSRNKEKGEPIPMCGVPYHAAEGYIARLIQKGYRVAICDQMEEAGPGKKLVRRELTRVVTPGTATESSLLRSHENNYLAAVCRNGTRAGLAHVDISTGEFRVTELDAVRAGRRARKSQRRAKCWSPESRHRSSRTADRARRLGLRPRLRRPRSARAFPSAVAGWLRLGGKPLAVSAAGAILHYLRDTQKSALDHLDRPSFYDRGDAMVLDAVTVRNLELVEPLFAGESRESTLDSRARPDCDRHGRPAAAQSPAASLPRASRKSARGWMRSRSVLKSTIARSEIRKLLAGVLDLERLLAKLTLGTAGPRELLALGRSLALVPEVETARRRVRAPRVCSRLHADARRDPRGARPHPHRHRRRAARRTWPTAAPSAPATTPNSTSCATSAATAGNTSPRSKPRERARTGIQSLKVRFNNVFGYYIEISKANLHHAPPDYERKQTLVNAERFTTPELKELESKVLDAEEKMLALEREIFQELRLFAAEHAARIRKTAAAMAELDVTCALAQVAAENRYVRPRFSETGEVRIVAGRHPVIEKLAAEGSAALHPERPLLRSVGPVHRR